MATLKKTKSESQINATYVCTLSTSVKKENLSKLYKKFKTFCVLFNSSLKGVFAKNERGYRRNAKNKSF